MKCAEKRDARVRLSLCRYVDVAALLTLKANWFDTLTVKQLEVMINNVFLSSATNEETPYISFFITALLGSFSNDDGDGRVASLLKRFCVKSLPRLFQLAGNVKCK